MLGYGSLAFVLAACAANPKTVFREQVSYSSTPLATTPMEAVRNASVEPLPVNPGWMPPQWQITVNEPRMLVDGIPSNYRVFSIPLQQSEPFNFQVTSLCVNGCFGFLKYALKPYAMVVAKDGAVLSSRPSAIQAVVGYIRITMSGVAPEAGVYYLIVLADNKYLGQTIVFDNLLMPGSNTPVVPVLVHMQAYPVGRINAFAVKPVKQ
ncbi:hypothetical protein [Pseudothauera rhizosphaerae]|uniref:Uncharacterized protein n=1 Tax=Pseudothauera rhizosphaerae TaxID=2565932 RepID=A0A4S4AU37_9RHOO|nr:hypothetical protein [Pseudothauera rhizosphaerae]THF63406.1 hypothetical protein E6O51_04940 [Pseudothauera rhizosphaerae]